MWQSPYHHHHSLGGLLDQQPQPPQQQNGKEPLTAKYCLLCEDHHVVTSHCRWQILKHTVYISVLWSRNTSTFFGAGSSFVPFFGFGFSSSYILPLKLFYNYIIIVPYKRVRNEFFFILASSKLTAENIYKKDNFGSGLKGQCHENFFQTETKER